MNYYWKPEARIKIDANQAGIELEQISARFEDGLTPKNLVQASEPEAAPLHSHFEWNDMVAAGRYRQDQARYLLRMIVIDGNEDKEVEEQRLIRAFVPISSEGDGNEYVNIVRVMSDTEMRQQVLTRAWEELEAWRRRYEDYEELAHVFAAISVVRKPELVAVSS